MQRHVAGYGLRERKIKGMNSEFGRENSKDFCSTD